jgi:hypothetical protein
MFGGMALLMVILPPWLPWREAWPMYLFLAIVSGGLLLVPFLLLRRLLRTLSAARAKNRGILREGIFIGREGLLVRLEPNRCHPIVAECFVEARVRVSGGDGGGDIEPKEMFRIETLDGAMEFFQRTAGRNAPSSESLRPGVGLREVEETSGNGK